MIDTEAAVPDFRSFHDKLLSGEVTMAENPQRVQYAMVHLERVLQNMRSDRFEEALDQVAAGNGERQSRSRHRGTAILPRC